MIRHLRLAPAALIVLAVGSTSAFAQTPPNDAPPELPPPSEAAPPPAPEPLPPPPAPPAPAPVAAKGTPPFKLEAANGSSIKFGLLLQSQFQAVNSATDMQDGFSMNLFLRRARILVGGNLFGSIDYFVETDFANLFLAGPGTDAMGNAGYFKSTPGMNVQDAFATWKAMGDMVKVDVGYMLPPLAHNALQGAGTLLGVDYFTNSFRNSGSFGSAGNPVGRDVGVQVRGLLGDGLIEYRAGLFQGLRNAPTATEAGAKNFFRAAARVQLNLLDAETGFFYGGTYLGTKKIASIGASFDFQDKYKYFAVDGILDIPAGPGVVSAQANFAQWDGGTYIASLPKQHAIMGEAGYILNDLHLAPMARFEQLKFSGSGVTDTRVGGGVAFFPYGHNSNLKLTVMSVDTGAAGARKQTQINLQWQVYYF